MTMETRSAHPSLHSHSNKPGALLALRGWVVSGALLLSCCAAEMPDTQSTANPSESKSGENKSQPQTSSTPALSTSGQTLLAQLVKHTKEAATRVVGSADGQEATAVFSVLGVDMRKGSNAHLAMPCEGERPASKPTCGSDFPGAMPFLGKFDTCFTQGCLGPKQSYADVYVTSDPSHLPDARAPISFPTMAPVPAGTVTYDPNPLVRWVTDATDPAAVRVKAELAQNVHIALDGEKPLDFSYEGVVEGVRTDGKYTMTIDLKLPMLITSHAVSVSVKQNEDMSVSGKIVAGETMLGDVSGATVSWAQ